MQLVIAVSLVVPLLIVAGNYINRKDVQERPLQVGEAVSVKNVSKGWRPGFIRRIGPDGVIEVAMGETRGIAARPSSDVIRLDGTGRLKRRQEPAP